MNEVSITAETNRNIDEVFKSVTCLHAIALRFYSKKFSQRRLRIVAGSRLNSFLPNQDGLVLKNCKKVWRRKEMIHVQKHKIAAVEYCRTWACNHILADVHNKDKKKVAVSETGSLVFIDHVTADRSYRMNSHVYRAKLQTRSWQRNVIFFNGQVSHLISTQQPKDKSEGRKTHKQAAAERRCSKDLAKHLEG